MNRVYLHEGDLPFCLGCGHTLIAENVDKALQTLKLDPLDVILVTDIGCHGIIDKSFKTHTVHGLHGRSVALASGISLSLNNPDKKIIVFIGDGGATIGLQHLIDSAHRNFNMTVVLHNNMLYGMTGGQPSELTPLGFKTPTLPEGSTQKGFDMCEVVAAAGASYVCRLMGIGNIAEQLAVALGKKGFSLVEVMELCPSYAVKSNPGMKLRQVVEEAGLGIRLYADRDFAGYETEVKTETTSLIDKEKVISCDFTSALKNPARIMISGSAGEGVQAAAEFFARAAIASGLNVTKKGSYPVTVGIGFSSSDIILSPERILYTGSPSPDYMIITSQDGLDHSLSTIKNMQEGFIFLDESLPIPNTTIPVIRLGFRKLAGNKNAAIFSLLYLAIHQRLFPAEAMLQMLGQSKLAGKADWNALVAMLP